MDLRVTLLEEQALKPIPDVATLEFGKQTTDHMVRIEYTTGQGWRDAQIVPYGPVDLDPSALVLHYNQQIFEGLKAFRQPDGSVSLFRPDCYANRFRRSARRMAMPELEPETFIQVVKALVQTDERWVPSEPGTSLYIRPTMIATEPGLGVRASETYLFYVIACPVGAYYKEGARPTRITVEEDSARAAAGGAGEAKTSGNYAPTLLATQQAVEDGFSQVLWLDTKEHRYVEEVGTSNIFFRFGEELVTPPLGGTILPGVTRDSVLELAERWDLKMTERRVSIHEVMDACTSGLLKESFATGTAAVVSPIGELSYKSECVTVDSGEPGDLSCRFYDEITDVQYGRKDDVMGWMVPVGE
ncbi:TPA: branched chain amino acid aminotransferase [Candidatus Latescibacteria bacterium]|nr:branched chain amino acid aminotransferase [Candidatus Latescibacterota bacterium]